MAPKLTDEQRSAVERQAGQPVQVVDPASEAVYYLISDEQFQRIRALLATDPFDIRDTYAAQSQALSAVWDDPALDEYNDPESPPGSP